MKFVQGRASGENLDRDLDAHGCRDGPFALQPDSKSFARGRHSPEAMTTENDPENMTELRELRKAGLKVTHPRMRVLEILEASRSHLTAEDIYKRLLGDDQDIGLATVYRVLTQFEAAGLVTKHNFEGGQAVYELDRGKHHDHMIDVETGKVIEFVNEEIERLQREIAAKHGYDLADHSLVLYVRPKKKGPRA